MRPSEGRGVRQKIGRAVQTLAFSVVDGLAEVFGVPVGDDGGEQIEAGHAEVLAFGGAVADFTLAADAQGVFQGMMGLSLVETNLGAALHVGIEQPFDDEQRPFHPPDFLEGFGQRVLAGVTSLCPPLVRGQWRVRICAAVGWAA